ncbi:hypothetical protein PAAG_01912 [Paracoccidioides lutzii Pb01]|uniref:Uncharacterized protein n=1 Tax=Paracoccidioides lutzii (strain ATCC MYA-826 / Pb01) TaxID=502779 RepID=C1GTR7_PARBA|nr:hypothetical protein PAAG_01912 [Paracoccidioides lutzii Pb01]EEH39723.2 hypothetical protein PAAG_01912 [Paracoccidioides lutzii Pb01]
MAANEPVIFSFLSPEIEAAREKAWNESKPVADTLPKPESSVIAPFLPTEFCDDLIDVVIKEYPKIFQMICSKAYVPKSVSKCRRGGLVYFPGKPDIGMFYTIVIPLHVSGMVKIGDQVIDTNHIYNVLSSCFVEVPEGGKLAALVMDKIE